MSVEQNELRTPRNALVVRAELVSSQKLACGKQMVPKCIAGSFVQVCAKRRALPGLDGVENFGGTLRSSSSSALWLVVCWQPPWTSRAGDLLSELDRLHVSHGLALEPDDGSHDPLRTVVDPALCILPARAFQSRRHPGQVLSLARENIALVRTLQVTDERGIEIVETDVG